MTTAFGPQGPNYTTTRPARDPQASSGVDTWFTNCSAAGATDGTYATADFFNVIIANLRYVCREADVTLNNADDTMLWQAIQAAILGNASGASYLPSTAVWQGSFAGAQAITPNVLTPINFTGSAAPWGTWNGNTMTIATAGKYLVALNVAMYTSQTTATSSTSQVSVLKNGHNYGTHLSANQGSSTALICEGVTVVLDCNVGDTIQAAAWISSAYGQSGGITTQEDSAYANNLRIVKLN